MSYGCEYINDEPVRFGFANVSDWLTSIIMSFPAPWRILPLDGKYYGTEVADARGVVIWTCWTMNNYKASARVIAKFTNEYDPTDALKEYCCDCHYETQEAYDNCARFVDLRNSYEDGATPLEGDSELIRLLLLGRWEEVIWPDLFCGGPNKRALVSSLLP